MTLTQRIHSVVACLMCDATKKLPETGTTIERSFTGQRMVSIGISPEVLATQAGYRRLVVDSTDPVEYGTAFDGYVCKECYGSVLDLVNAARAKAGIR